jgi:hypothetical protein
MSPSACEPRMSGRPLSSLQGVSGIEYGETSSSPMLRA